MTYEERTHWIDRAFYQFSLNMMPEESADAAMVAFVANILLLYDRMCGFPELLIERAWSIYQLEKNHDEEVSQ